ncbi:MAG: galactose mutarotase [Lachnospiraceae bacterium]|nr:galactose mutarotase [Lachnospiraceae bacterium]
MAVEKRVYGKNAEGKELLIFTLSNKNGMQVELTNLGAIIVKLLVPDSKGEVADVVLGFDELEAYEKNPSFFGAVIGPNANRIADAQFEIDGVTYQLDRNDNRKNNLHSHIVKGYHKAVWQTQEGVNSVTFTLEDEDGNMGFPGNKKVEVTYTLDEDNGLTLHYHGSSDAKTVLNLTNHTYFNLDGHDSGSIEDHELWLGCSRYTPVVAGAIPTGELAPVAGTVMDFTTAKKIGQDINDSFKQLKLTGGYDHNWVIDEAKEEMVHFATVKGPKSGRVMKAYTNLPGVQFYAGNAIANQKGKDGVKYGKRHGLCLETQYFPDSVHRENFPSCIFGAGEDYDSVTVYRFEA